VVLCVCVEKREDESSAQTRARIRQLARTRAQHPHSAATCPPV
jgi:hypothetical protein